MLLLRVPSVRLLLLLLLLLLRCPRRVDLLLMLRWVALRWVDLLLLLLRWVALLRRVALCWVCVTCRRCRRIVLASRRGGVACALEYRMSAVQRQNNIHIRKIVMPSGRPLPRSATRIKTLTFNQSTVPCCRDLANATFSHMPRSSSIDFYFTVGKLSGQGKGTAHRPLSDSSVVGKIGEPRVMV